MPDDHDLIFFGAKRKVKTQYELGTFGAYIDRDYGLNNLAEKTRKMLIVIAERYFLKCPNP